MSNQVFSNSIDRYTPPKKENVYGYATDVSLTSTPSGTLGQFRWLTCNDVERVPPVDPNNGVWVYPGAVEVETLGEPTIQVIDGVLDGMFINIREDGVYSLNGTFPIQTTVANTNVTIAIDVGEFNGLIWTYETRFASTVFCKNQIICVPISTIMHLSAGQRIIVKYNTQGGGTMFHVPSPTSYVVGKFSIARL